MKNEARWIDIVIPTYNEALSIQQLIESVHNCKSVGKIIVVDGGSTDQTKSKVEGYSKVSWIQTRPGRGHQQNVGGAQANADVLLFLHADIKLPNDWDILIDQALSHAEVVGGAFKIQTVADPLYEGWADSLLWIADIRSKYTRYPYGDQCLFVRRSTFEEIGGYPDQVLFEDYEFSKAISRFGKLEIISEKVRVSGRRMQKRPIRSFVMMNLLPLLYKLGVSPGRLRDLYK